MTFNKMGTLPLPLALHLATYTVIGLFCPHWPLGALLLAIGAYGLATLALYRRQILEA
jgi:hypothetical protein